MKTVFRSMIAICLLGSSAAQAAETIIYTYDANGRVIKVVRSGSVNNGKTTTYEHDKADNRKKVKVTGAP
jgi:YD repeat-containing protein